MCVLTLLRKGAQALQEPCSILLVDTTEHAAAAEVYYASEDGDARADPRCATWPDALRHVAGCEVKQSAKQEHENFDSN